MRPLTRAVFLTLAALLASSAGARAGFDLGLGSNYAILFEGGGGNTLQITNVTTNTTGGNTGVAAGQGNGIGNIGVGNTGKVSLSGPGTINGNLDIAAANNGQVTGSGVTITGSTKYGVPAVASALNTVNALNSTLGALSGTTAVISGNTTINALNGTFYASGAGYTDIRVFTVDLSKFSLNNGQTLTINGDANGDAVVFNFLGSANFHGNVALTGGLSPDDVLFNFVGGSNLSGGPTLDLNNGGGSPSNGSYLSQGIFLDPNGPISVINSNVLGRIFGGDSHDFQYVSGSNITAPFRTAVPAPSTVALALAGAAPLGLLAVLRRRGRVAPTLPT
jgi:hypothetical protein